MGMTTTTHTLTLTGLEVAYDTLASAIDQAGPEKTELFLVKLVLLAARDLGDAAHFQALVKSAMKDL
jgi:hypothetical protein